VSIGEGSCINVGSYAIGHAFQYGLLRTDKLTIADRCNLGTKAQLVPGVTLEPKSSLCALSRAFNGEVLKEETIYGGMPAKRMVSVLQ